jgi:tetraacyldisaccharide 4'-kinase
MISKTSLLDIVSGEKTGLAAAVTRMVLWALTPAYRIAVAIRNRKYTRDTSAVTRVDVPVISIGNLTTGGTGKSPMVIWVCRRLRAFGLRVAIISRGYGGQRSGDAARPNDEALEMQQRLPDVPQLQDPDRIKSAYIAIEELESQCLIMDDGFQHRRLHRDLDVVLIDATNPFGYGHLLPRGLLREPIGSLSRAHVVVITRCQQVDQVAIDSILDVISQATAENHPQPVVCQTHTVPKCWLQFDGQSMEISEFGAVPVVACCAIGNPESFIKTATLAGANVVGQKFFSDHHTFTRSDIQSVVQLAREKGANRIICTHKDLVKIATNQLEGIPFFALQIDLEFTHGEEAFKERLGLVTANVQH